MEEQRTMASRSRRNMLFPPRTAAKSMLPPRSSPKKEELTTLAGHLDHNETKSCLPWRYYKGKIAATDVASIDASDTLVESDSIRLSGRDLHESAKSLLNEGQLARALEAFETILQAQLGRFGALHPSVAAAMHNVGVVRQRMQQHALAEECLAQAVQIRKQTLGPDHLEVAASLSKLGAAQASLGKFDDAYENILMAIRIAEMQLGRRHKTVAQMLCHLACFYFETGELYAAQATFQDAYEIYKDVLPLCVDRNACMTQMTDTLCNIGSIQNRKKRFADAIRTFSEAIELQRGFLGGDHPRVIATLDQLAFSFSKNKEYKNALTCYQTMYKAQLASGYSQDCYETFRKQIVMYEKLKKIPEAIEATRETLRFQKTILPRPGEMIDATTELLDGLTLKLRPE